MWYLYLVESRWVNPFATCDVYMRHFSTVYNDTLVAKGLINKL